MVQVNFLAVIVCAIVSMIVGSIWYGPLFGKKWMKHFNFSKEDMEKGKKEMPKTYSMMFVGSVVTSYVLAVVVGMAPMHDMITGIVGAFWIWLGFIAAVKFSEVLFEKKPLEVFYIECGYYFVFLLIAGAILGSWA